MNHTEFALTIVQEEAAEIIQIISKIKRFGLEEVYQKSGKSNIDRFVDEYNDFQATVRYLGDVLGKQLKGLNDKQAIEDKIEKIEMYLRYSRSLGTVEKETV